MSFWRRNPKYPCPHCGVTCEATWNSTTQSTTLHHPLPLCDGFKSKKMGGDMLRAYVFHCKPDYRFPALEMPKEWKDS